MSDAKLLAPVERPWPIPQGVSTAVTLRELVTLQRFAAEAGTVLEIGSLFGYSAVGMALAGARVISVDPHHDGPPHQPDTWEAFLANLDRHGVRDRVCPFRSPIEEWERLSIPPGWGLGWGTSWGMAFVDGNHIWPCPRRDALIATEGLVAPGFLAFHDVSPNWPGVYRAYHELVGEGWAEVARVQTLRVLRRPQIQVSASSVAGSSSTPTVTR